MQAAETAWIVESQGVPGVEHEIEMIVRDSGQVRRQDSQAAGHSQVQQERARLQLEQQVFRAALGMQDALSCNQVRQVILYAPAKSPLVELKRHDPTAYRVGLDPPAGCLNFGQFRCQLAGLRGCAKIRSV